LEQLPPVERAVFQLREVFEYDYAEIASFLGKSEAACRQAFSHHVRTFAKRLKTATSNESWSYSGRMPSLALTSSLEK